jgi:hypothetical protein
MKQIYTLSFLLFSFTAFSQTKSANANSPEKSAIEQKSRETPSNTVRNSSVSAQGRVSQPAPLPYDVNDKYMGRGEEFLANLTVDKLPGDFPLYEKQWSLKEYNQVVLAFYYNHLDIVKEGVRKKLELLKH